MSDQKQFDFLVIGGGPAALACAEMIRSKKPEASIAVCGDEPYAPYSRVQLADYVLGLADDAKISLRRDGALAEKNIAYFFNKRAVSLKREERSVVFSDGTEFGYGRLCVATGASAKRLSVAGSDDARILYFQNLNEAKAVKSAFVAGKRVLTYGGGFIAIELAATAAELGCRVTSALRGEGFFARLLAAPAVAQILEKIRASGISLKLKTTISSIEKLENSLKVIFSDGSSQEFDYIACGLGITPNVAWLNGSGIACADGVLTDSGMRTNDSDVFAAGDCAEFFDELLNENRLNLIWQNALFSARVAGANMAGGQEKYSLVTMHGLNYFDLPLAFLGAAESAGDAKVDRVYPDGSTVRLTLKNNSIIGAASSGNFSERAVVSELIRSKRALSVEEMASLADASMPLKK